MFYLTLRKLIPAGRAAHSVLSGVHAASTDRNHLSHIELGNNHYLERKEKQTTAGKASHPAESISSFNDDLSF